MPRYLTGSINSPHNPEINAPLMKHCSKIITKSGLPPSDEGLREVVKNHPWFTSAKLLLLKDDTGYGDTLELYLASYPAPANILRGTCYMGKETGGNDPTIDMIDSFLSSGGERRIVPSGNIPDDYDASAGGSNIEIDDDMATEQLAEIYAAQGLHGQAAEIFRRLGKEYVYRGESGESGESPEGQ